MGAGSTRGRSNRRRGKEAELAVCKWLRANGFPHAERAVRAGFAVAGRRGGDHGDITGTPGVVWQVKDVAKSSVPSWLRETEAQRVAGGAEHGVLVYRRRGVADAGQWRAWLIAGNGLLEMDDYPLASVVKTLRAWGYGEPLEVGS